MCSTAPKNTCLNPTLSFPFNQVFSHSKGVFRYLYSLTNCFPSEASGMEPSNSSFSPNSVLSAPLGATNSHISLSQHVDVYRFSCCSRPSPCYNNTSSSIPPLSLGLAEPTVDVPPPPIIAITHAPFG